MLKYVTLAKFIFIVCISSLNSCVSIFTYIRTKKAIKNNGSSVFNRLTAYANCFSIGLFLAICFLGLYNSSTHKFTHIQKSLSSSNGLKTYPLSEFLLCIGIFGFWLFEWVISLAMKSMNKKKAYHQKGTAIPTSFQSENTDSVALNEDKIDLLTHTASGSCTISNYSIDNEDSTVYLKSVILCMGLGFHSLLEALGFGFLELYNQVISMGTAMALHNVLCSGMLSFRLAKVSNKPKTNSTYAILILTIYLLMVPCGSAIGITLHHTYLTNLKTNCSASGIPENEMNGDLLTKACATNIDQESLGQELFMAIIQNIAAAAFLYVVFVEILPAEVNASLGSSTCKSEYSRTKERANRTRHPMLCWLFAFIGFTTIAVIRLIHLH